MYSQILLGQIALYRNPTSCRPFFESLESVLLEDPLLLLSVGASELTHSNNRSNLFV